MEGSSIFKNSRHALVVILSIVVLVTIGGVYAVYFSSFAVNQVLEDQESLIERTNNLEEVRTFLVQYENPRVRVQTDDALRVFYGVPECDLNSRPCSVTEMYPIYLEIILDNRGFPKDTSFSCFGNFSRAPLNDQGMIQTIKNCS